MARSPHTISLGCRLNAYETERMAHLAAETQLGDVVIVNTCAVTGEAVRQSRQAIRKAHKDQPDAKIIVSGCAAQLEPAAFAELPGVTRVIGNADKLSHAAWKSDVAPGDVFKADVLSQQPDPVGRVPARAHLEVQNGCDHRCTFCIIPFGRGKARSKPPMDVLAEARSLVAKGAKEIVLTGVDLTSYGPDLGEDITLSDAIEALLLGLPASIRIRLSSIDGAEIDDRLFRLVTEEERIAPHLHLSLQSGDTMILKRMKRRHTREDAVALCAKLKAARPDLAFGADLIAGFPTETEEMFANSLTLIDDCQLSFVHVFPFSPRVGTPAAKMPQHDKRLIKERAARLRAKSDGALKIYLNSKIGQRTELLIEQFKDGQCLGKTPDFADMAIPYELYDQPGDMVPVRITAVTDRYLRAERINHE